VAGLRERKRRKTFKAIHDAALRLFEERGYAAVTVADIAEAADVSRATVFTYYPAKEDIVLGDARFAIDGLEAALADPDVPVVDVVREWLRSLVGWIEPDIVFQRRLAEEVPAVGAVRSRVRRDIEAVIADALTRQMGSDDPLVPRLVAGALGSALFAVEDEVARRFESGGDALSEPEVDALFDKAVAFMDGGLERIQT
jgi:AcrR family transcriptional regulator